MKLMSSLFKEDPLHKELKKIGVFTDQLSVKSISTAVELFREKIKANQEEHYLKIVIKQL